MSKASNFLHGVGALIAKASVAAGPDVSNQMAAVGKGVHAIADLVESKAAQAYLGPVFGTLLGNMLNSATDQAAADLGGTGHEPVPGG